MAHTFLAILTSHDRSHNSFGFCARLQHIYRIIICVLYESIMRCVAACSVTYSRIMLLVFFKNNAKRKPKSQITVISTYINWDEWTVKVEMEHKVKIQMRNQLDALFGLLPKNLLLALFCLFLRQLCLCISSIAFSAFLIISWSTTASYYTIASFDPIGESSKNSIVKYCLCLSAVINLHSFQCSSALHRNE